MFSKIKESVNKEVDESVNERYISLVEFVGQVQRIGADTTIKNDGKVVIVFSEESVKEFDNAVQAYDYMKSLV